uniref:Uncharacterized protein n=1 Tax=Romanomermis culicivorax TaxID=13658 RepID=A0A915KLJ8_ROMCU
MTKTTRPAYPMQIGFGVSRKIEVNHDINGLNIYTTSQRGNNLDANGTGLMMRNSLPTVYTIIYLPFIP